MHLKYLLNFNRYRLSDFCADNRYLTDNRCITNYCHHKGKQKYIEGEHKNECLKFPLACSNKCEIETVPREDLEAHREKCPLEMIQCQYHHVGCEARMVRRDQKKHNKEKVEEHLMMTI